MQPKIVGKMAEEMKEELTSNILPFWPKYLDGPNGGFYGRVANDGSFDSTAPKGIVQHSRLMWVYARAYRCLGERSLLPTSRAAYSFITERFLDAPSGGFHWTVDCAGRPEDRLKRIYGQAFAIYALAEYARADGGNRPLELAMETFRLLEKAARDPERGGYFEAAAPDWSGPASSALSDIDMDCEKSMNTNLHVMEALTALHEAGGDPAVKSALRDIVDIHLDRILAHGTHLGLYFDRAWRRLDSMESYGHDIEASWLITEAATRAWDGTLPPRVKEAVLSLADGTARVLLENGGTLPNEMRNGRMDAQRIWWVQAEAIVGLVNAWELSGIALYLELAAEVWRFIKERIVDRRRGEWLWGTHPDGTPLEEREKGGLWKAGYHEGRLCMEIMERASRIEGK